MLVTLFFNLSYKDVLSLENVSSGTCVLFIMYAIPQLNGILYMEVPTGCPEPDALNKDPKTACF